MRILYCPIFEAGSVHETALTHKRGLFNALSKRAHVWEFDYLANDADTLYQGFVNRIDTFEPDMLLTQFHAGDVLTPEQIRELRALRPETIFCNWVGDSWTHSLTSPVMLALAKEYDLWLVAAPDALPIYEHEGGIRAAYWQIAWEPPVSELPDVPSYDVVWLANVINEKRLVLMKRLRQLEGISVGIYGDWSESDGRCVYNFPMQRALYQNATLAIADNVYEQQTNYISDRPLQILASGGAMLLHQHVPKMRELTYGWEPNEHYIEWSNHDDLETLIRDWLRPERKEERERIVANGKTHALQYHSFEARVNQLFDVLLPQLAKADT